MEVAQQTSYEDGPQQTQHEKWIYIEDDDTTCDCKEADQTMDHLLECPMLQKTCHALWLILQYTTIQQRTASNNGLDWCSDTTRRRLYRTFLFDYSFYNVTFIYHCIHVKRTMSTLLEIKSELGNTKLIICNIDIPPASPSSNEYQSSMELLQTTPPPHPYTW